MKMLPAVLFFSICMIGPAGTLVQAIDQNGNVPSGNMAASSQPYQPVAKTETWWTQRHAELLRRTKQGNADLLFLGDSIMQGWNCRFMLADPATPHDGAGRELWDKLYAPLNAANQSIGGDRIENLLWRITAGGEIDGFSPKVIVLLIGTNSLAAKDPPERVAAGVGQVLRELGTRMPNAKILLLGIFPRGQKSDDPLRLPIRETNALLAKMDDGKRVHFLDFGSQFLSPDGSISTEIMGDYVHPTAKGYAVWAEAMRPSLDRLWRH